MIKEIKSNAKINIGLNVEGVLDNGYHLLDMVVVPIDLSDKLVIDFKEKKGGLKIFTEEKNIPTDERNILYKVYTAFYKKSGIEPEEIEVYLEKNIPSEAGLGGGSSNGAFFLKELNNYHGNIFSCEELISFSKNIGADIPFFIINKSSRVKGIGEEIESFENNLKSNIILIKPPFGVSTPVAFKLCDSLNSEQKDKKANILKIIEGLFENNLYKTKHGIENQLEIALLTENEEIKKFRSKLQSFQNQNFYMSGSGSTYFTFVDEKDSLSIYNKLKQEFKECKIYMSKFLG